MCFAKNVYSFCNRVQSKYLIFSDLASETDVKKLKSLKSSENEDKKYHIPIKKELLKRKDKIFKQNDHNI